MGPGASGEVGSSKKSAEIALGLLRSFNRKERYHLLRAAVTGDAFSLTDDFCRLLEEELQWTIPPGAFVAMDYHFDWIAAALVLASKYASQISLQGKESPEDIAAAVGKVSRDDESPWLAAFQARSEPCYAEGGYVLSGTQQDVDLLVAYMDTERGALRLVMVEAKVESGWDGRQISNKGQRLCEIFGQQCERFDFVEARFILAGPPKEGGGGPAFKKVGDLPQFMLRKDGGKKDGKESLLHIPLCSEHSLYRPARHSQEAGSAWKVVRTFTRS